jgi:FtsH-binding integral membrane protein
MLNIYKKQLYYILCILPFNIGIIYNLIINAYDSWENEILFVFYCVLMAICFRMCRCNNENNII